MGKISPVASKYIVHVNIEIEGIVDKPDVIGAVFGQTEGLLGSELELRELQRSGRIGRIEVNLTTKQGKTSGEIIIPSSLDKAETVIVAAALEIIERIGPCNAKVVVKDVEDVRISKRTQVVDRAKYLLKQMMQNTMPDSQELAEEVAQSVRVMEITEFGKEKLPAGPSVEEADEILIVEGRADVLTLLKHGIKNAIAMNGSNVPPTLAELTKRKIVTVFVDGDRGGDLNIQQLLQVGDIDFVTRAPDGKEVEELTQKEILKALRGKITAEQAKMELEKNGLSNKFIDKTRKQNETHQQQRPQQQRPQQQNTTQNNTQNNRNARQGVRYQQRPQQQNTTQNNTQNNRNARQGVRYQPQTATSNNEPTTKEKNKFSELLDSLIGTRGAYLLDSSLNILGKVPMTELISTMEGLNTGVYAIIMDNSIEKDVVAIAEKSDVSFVVGMDLKVDKKQSKVSLLTIEDL